MDITKEEFLDYENIRLSGRTNMFDISTVIALSDGLSKEKIFFIMKNYGKLSKKYL